MGNKVHSYSVRVLDTVINSSSRFGNQAKQTGSLIGYPIQEPDIGASLRHAFVREKDPIHNILPGYAL